MTQVAGPDKVSGWNRHTRRHSSVFWSLHDYKAVTGHCPERSTRPDPSDMGNKGLQSLPCLVSYLHQEAKASTAGGEAGTPRTCWSQVKGFASG